jgi:galactokinase
MDQFASALACAGHALMLDCKTLAYEHIPFPAGVVMAVIDSGIRRALDNTAYNRRRAELEAGMPKRVRHVESEIERVLQFAAAMREGDTRKMGELIDASHRSLSEDYEVSVPAMDELCAAARRAPGCLGARQMGGGFGGAALALVEAGREREFESCLDRPVLFVETADGAYAGQAA